MKRFAVLFLVTLATALPAWSAEPITALVHLVLARCTVLVPALPPAENRAG